MEKMQETMKTRENRKRWHDYRKALLDGREHKYMKGRKDVFSFVYFITGYFHCAYIIRLRQLKKTIFKP